MRFWRVGIALTISALVVGPVAAQTTVDSISARLVGKVVFLRGGWSGSKLNFDADGHPLKTYRPQTFAESGLKVASVKMDGAKLRIDGERAALAFDPKGVASLVKSGGKAVMTIDSSADFDKAVDAIFSPNLQDMIPSMPDYWVPYATKHFLAGGITLRTDDTSTLAKTDVGKATAAVDQPDGTMHVGGTVKPPRVLQSSDPSYNDTARQLMFSGNVQVYLWVDERGNPTHIQVARPVGLGLDDVAVAAVKEYKFAPATWDGKPVKVDLYIDVNFQIH